MLEVVATIIINIIGGALGFMVIVSILAIIIGLPIMFRKEENDDKESI